MIFTITVTDADAPDVLAALAEQHGYRPKLMQPDPASKGKLVAVDNPETPEAFARRMLREHVAQTVLRFRQRAAQAAAAAGVQPVTVT